MSNFKKGDENTFPAGASPRGFKKSGSPSPRVDDLKDVECFKCHKKGHYANKCPESKAKDAKAPMKVRKIEDFGLKPDSEAKSVRQIRIRYSDIEDKSSDPFMRHRIILSKLGEIRLGSDNEGHLARIFIDTGENCDTIHQKVLLYSVRPRS